MDLAITFLHLISARMQDVHPVSVDYRGFLSNCVVGVDAFGTPGLYRRSKAIPTSFRPYRRRYPPGHRLWRYTAGIGAADRIMLALRPMAASARKPVINQGKIFRMFTRLFPLSACTAFRFSRMPIYAKTRTVGMIAISKRVCVYISTEKFFGKRTCRGE